MTQHFTKNTVSATFYCPKCGRSTSHRIDDGRKGPCLECMARFDAKPKPEAAGPVTNLQREMFR